MWRFFPGDNLLNISSTIWIYRTRNRMLPFRTSFGLLVAAALAGLATCVEGQVPPVLNSPPQKQTTNGGQPPLVAYSTASRSASSAATSSSPASAQATRVTAPSSTTTPGPTAPVIVVELGKNICDQCACANKQIKCNKTKFTDLLNIRAPDDYNIVDLSSNQLTKIHQDSFVAGRDVTELNLAYNHIHSIADFSFRTFKNLTGLVLAHNNLAVLEDDSLSGLSGLEKLDLSQNLFKRINPEYFAKLHSLKYLILDQNHLEGLHGSCFQNNTKLTHLFLNKIGLDKLDKGLFQYTRDLRVLHLEDNFFESVPRQALTLLTKLEVLVLSGNPIHYIAPLDLPKMPNLQQLKLDNLYNLLKIETYAFSDLPMLRDLKIQRCRSLLYIDSKAFALNMSSGPVRYPHIKHLVIHDTSVASLAADLLDWAQVDDMDLSANPFHCNCNLSWIVPFVRRHDVNNDIRCHGPDALANQVIGRMKPEQMLCDDFDPLSSEAALLDPAADDAAAAVAAAAERGFSLLHLALVVLLTMCVLLSVLLALSLRSNGGGGLRGASDGFLYRKLGKKPNYPMTYAGGENVLYMRTTIDN